jgi:hypothetical protein
MFNVGDWVEIDTGFYKGTLAQVTQICPSCTEVVFFDSGTYHCQSYFGEGCFKQKPTAPNREYEDLFL